jgi:NDP-sugar pyrophosphorylase family protein
MYRVAILAGGLATRLRPVTATIPKALIEIAGKPFICHQLDYLRDQGITSVVMCIGFLGELIEALVGDGSAWGLKVTYSLDGPLLLGTGGSLKKALPLLGENFFVLYGDSYLPIDFLSVQNAYIKSKKSSLMTILKNKDQWDKSNVQFDGNNILEYNKDHTREEMTYIDYGLGILRASVLMQYSEKKPFDLSKVYNQLSLNEQLAGYEVFERFYEIGSHQGIEDTNSYLLKKIAKDC